VPAGGAGVAYSRAQYVGSPPLSLRRLLSDDGPRVRYGDNDHQPQPRPEEEGSALTCSGRLGQPMRPTGGHRLRSEGWPATCKTKKVRGGLPAFMVALGRLSKGTERLVPQKTARERVLARTGREPRQGARCGRERRRWQGGHPRDGVVDAEGQAITRGRDGPCRGSPPGAGVDGDRAKVMTQLARADFGV